MRLRLLAGVLPIFLAAGMAQTLAAAEPFRDPSLPLRPNETRTVRLPLQGTDLTYWGAEKRNFVVEPGRVSIMLGASSAGARLEKTIEVKEK